MVVALASGCLLAPAGAAANLGDGAGTDEPLLGVPGLAGLIADRAELTLDPDYWTQFIRNALSARLIAPLPVDAVKPEQVLPTSPVAAGGGYVYPLRRRPRPLADVEYEWQGRTKTLAQFMRTSETDATVFVHNGRSSPSSTRTAGRPASRHQPWSVTKSFISSLVGIALAEGRVRSLQGPDRLLHPEAARHRLGGHDDPQPARDGVGRALGRGHARARRQHPGPAVGPGRSSTTTPTGELGQTRNEFLASLPRVAPQGTRFSYNSGNTQVLGWMLERLYRPAVQRDHLDEALEAGRNGRATRA